MISVDISLVLFLRHRCMIEMDVVIENNLLDHLWEIAYRSFYFPQSPLPRVDIIELMISLPLLTTLPV